MKKFALAALLIGSFMLASCLGAVKSYEKKPSLAVYEGTQKAAGLNGKVEIYRDGYGVPHIFTEDMHDLFFASGWVQAEDRLFQMVFMRAAYEGRVSELLGDMNVPGLGNTMEIDKHQRVMGMGWLGEAGEALMKEYNPEESAKFQAYCDGVNAYIATMKDWKDLPVEFQVLRVRPDPWRVRDVVAYGMFMGWELGSNMDVELERQAFINKFGPDMAWELAPMHFGIGPTIVPTDMLKNRLDKPRDIPPGGRPSDEELGLTPAPISGGFMELAQNEKAIRRFFHPDAPFASNDWIVSGKLTESGHAMLCNDPHLEHAQPSLFYLLHLKGAGIDAMGAAFAGVPFPVLGHTPKLAWGATTPPADVQDLFIETVDDAHPGKYLYKGEWRDFTIRVEKIKVRGRKAPVEFRISQSIHGPIINEVKSEAKDMPPLALRWAAWDYSRDLTVFEDLITSATIDDFMIKMRKRPRDSVKLMNIALMYDHLLKGKSIDDFVEAMYMITVPSQNWVGADADGHIVYLPGGLVPIRKKGIGVLPVPGRDGDFDWTGFIPLMELPHAIDPDRGYMATANNPVVDPRYYPYMFGTEHDEGWRAWRIEELIKELAPLSMDDMKRIQNDVQIKRAAWEVPIILRSYDKLKPANPLAQRAAEELRAWDYEASVDCPYVVVFWEFCRQFRRNVIADEVPPGYYEEHLSGFWTDNMILIKAMSDGEHPFFDDKTTPDKVETMDDMIVKSLADTMAAIDKTYGPDQKDRLWGDLHTLTYSHPLGIGPMKGMSVGPFRHEGARDTIRNASFAGRGDTPWAARSGPVLRHIMDMGDPDHALMVIDGSESGQWLSPHYDDMVKLYIGSKYITAVMDPEAVKAQAKYKMTLEP